MGNRSKAALLFFFLSVTFPAFGELRAGERFSIDHQDFRLWDSKGNTQTLSYFSDQSAILLLAWPGACADRAQILNWYQELEAGLQKQKVTALWINSQSTDRDEVNKTVNDKFHAPVLMDTSQTISQSLDLHAAGDYIVLDPNSWKVIAKGNWSDGALESRFRLAKKTASQGTGKCDLSLHQSPQLTWNAELAHSFFNNCVSCHMQYRFVDFFKSDKDVFNWQAMNRLMMRMNKMPPVPNDPALPNCTTDFNTVRNPKALDDILRWLEGGAPHDQKQNRDFISEIYKSETKRSAKFLQRHGKPAAIWGLKQPDVVPADGPDYYHVVQVAGPLDHDMEVTAYNMAPHSQARHHMHIYVLRKPLSQVDANVVSEDIEEETDSAYKGRPDLVRWTFPAALMRGYVDLENSSIFIGKGSYIVMSIHYHPDGRREKNLEQIYVYTNETGNPRPKRMVYRFNHPNDLVIPAGERDVVVNETVKTAGDMTLLEIKSHAHGRSKAFSLNVAFPDGTSQDICRLSTHDMSVVSHLERPIFIPKNSILTAKFEYDNSAQNPTNPDPTAIVRRGYYRKDEMALSELFFVIGHIRDKSAPVQSVKEAVRGNY